MHRPQLAASHQSQVLCGDARRYKSANMIQRINVAIPSSTQKRVLSSNDDFSFGDGTQIVMIKWTNRKCGLN
jgi:hypothetical protein